ncbi:type 2 lanthipeptide synthetase LanM family protein [Bradyrhizobium sp.]|uniref:type 2 lanthipeptide synthetase LanM family protein n=1 Tax=Bradyrhizobium sp. TaxID=376 RepID=UPI001D3299E5|nr:type 2 lanthipeptide synthetase LanM family protein [Bradyrhizobium sp.]MBI5320401.1 type 2 lantipeptide synthetase LanM [Bradyrhizobium sp.]
MLSPDRFARIAINSLSIRERIAAGLGAEGLTEPPEVAARLREWRGAAAEGDEALFLARLARDGLDLAGARSLLARPEIPADFALPEWCHVLGRVLDATPRLRDAALAPDAALTFRYLRPHEPLPFEELFVPFVETARALLSERGASALPAGVLDIFARDLVQGLVEIAARVLAVEFRTFLASLQFDDDGDTDVAPGPESREQYRRFVAATYRDGWYQLFEENCVMARLLATALSQWVRNVGEFDKRLFEDLPEIERAFGRQKPSGRLIAVETGLSDPHDGGRTVVSVEFSSGLRIIYKPRSLGVERAYFDFAAAINRLDVLLPFRILTILDRGDYGWVEFVEHRSCASEEEVRRYYRRSGNLLCLVYALNGSDFHFENLIAAGEHPVPIDLETICHHRMEIGGGDDVDEMTERLRLSVLATDLLPDPVKLDHQYFDISAFAHSDAEEGEADVVIWKRVNTDGMDYVCERQPPRPARNLPKLNGKTAVLDSYTTIILEGFEEAYRFLQQKADLLLDETGPLRAMFSHHSRFIYRPTALYSLILQRALHPSYVRDGVDFALQFEVLARKLIEAPDRPMTWPLIEAEMASLWQLDIPRFTARGDETALRLGPENSVAGCFADSAWNATRAKIRGLNESDLRWQRSLIAGSFDVRSANLGTDPATAREEFGDIEPLAEDALLSVAVDLANEIEAKALRQSNGDLGWMVLHYSPAAARYTLQPMENDLYNGRAGVGLFFAALEKFLPGSTYRALAHAALKPVRRWIRTAPDAELMEFGFGGYAGLASIAYGLTKAGQLLGEDDLIADAAIAARRIRSTQIEKDDSLDAMSGAAGAIPALLACYAATADEKILATAVACGRHLLQRRVPDQFGFRTWPTLEQRHITGFSHGAAGIAYALLQLYKVTGDAGFYEAAADAIGFEGRAFVADHNNWQDYRRAATGLAQGPQFCMAWCHGAPGIGLGRIAALDVMDTSEVRRDIEAALVSTSQADLLPRDHLCCGNTGLMDTLCSAGEQFPEGDWSRKARQLAARTVARGNRRGSFSIAFENGFFNPSLFQGTAGVGYQLLRLADPARIPSVLLLN